MKTSREEKAMWLIRPGPTDLRKASNGLTVTVQEGMGQKRLEKERFPWPATAEAAREISAEELGMLLAGIDFFKAHKTLYCKKVT